MPDADFPELSLTAVVFAGAGALQNLSFKSDGLGPLRAGFGVPDGTPGHCTIVQTALFSTSGGGATADAFPVEHVDVKLAGAASRTAEPSLLLTKPSSSLSDQGSTSSRSWGHLKARYRDQAGDK